MSKDNLSKRNYPCVSFVIPAFNCARTIKESLESIFNGNYQDNDEIIIVNDCSTDETANVLDSIKTSYPSIKIINNKDNLGAPASRNIGIKEAGRDYIFNLDSDDILVPGSRFDLERYLLDEEADIAVFGESHFFQTNIKEVTHTWIFKPGIMSLNDFLASNKLPGQNCIYTKKSWYEVGKYWEYDKGLLEDWGFFLKHITHGSKFVVLSGKYYYHRYGINSLFVRESSESKSKVSQMASRMILPYLELLEPEDADYIKSGEGYNNWFTELNKHPIRVKDTPLGQGYKVKYNYPVIIKVIFKKYFKLFFAKLA